MAGKTVVILGGGVGGVVAATRLRRLLEREHSVVLVDRNVWQSFPASFIWVMMGWRKPERISGDLRRLVRRGIELVVGEVTAIQPDQRRVVVAEDGHQRELAFDYLVVSLGADYSVEVIPGLGRGWTFYTLDGADGLREELSRFSEGRVVILIGGIPYKCPGAPCEGALLLDYHFRQRGIRHQVEIQVFTPEPYPLPVAGQKVGEQVMELLGRQEIRYRPRSHVAAVDDKGNVLRFRDGAETGYDLLIVVPALKVPQVVKEAGLVQQSEWVSVDRATLVTLFDGVYALGDLTAIPLANGMMLPKTGVFAHEEAEVVARNIAAEVKGDQPRWAFDGHGACFLETGFGRAAYVVGQFYAEPAPDVKMRRPGRLWHWAKVGLERLWLRRWL
jgi:sulfide:quinone oxidoreductase